MKTSKSHIRPKKPSGPFGTDYQNLYAEKCKELEAVEAVLNRVTFKTPLNSTAEKVNDLVNGIAVLSAVVNHSTKGFESIKILSDELQKQLNKKPTFWQRVKAVFFK